MAGGEVPIGHRRDGTKVLEEHSVFDRAAHLSRFAERIWSLNAGRLIAECWVYLAAFAAIFFTMARTSLRSLSFRLTE
jgi:hypothetical protein